MKKIKFILINQSEDFIKYNNICECNYIFYSGLNVLAREKNFFYVAVINDCSEDKRILDKIINFVDCVYIRNFQNNSKNIYSKPVIAKEFNDIQLPYIFIDTEDFNQVISIVNELNDNLSKLPFPSLDRIKSEEVSCRMVDVSDTDDGFKVKLH